MADRYSELADKLRPHLGSMRASGGGSAVTPPASAPAQADYIISVESGICRAHNGRTGQLVYTGGDHAAVIQQTVDAAGVGGVLAFRPGDYQIGAQLTPLARQSWLCVYGAVFRPTGNNRIIYAQQIDWWCVYGTLHIEDTDRNTSSVEAIYLNGIAACYFQHILIWDYYKGVTFTGEAQRSFENVFEYLYMAIIRHQGLAIWAEVGDNYFNNVFIKGPSTTEWATGQGLVIGLYPGVGTIFGGIMFGRVEVLDCQVNVDLQGLYEVWIDQLLSDNAFFAALYIGDRVQRLFVGTIWAAGSGEGIWIQGTPESTARRLRINQAFCWVNAVHGVLFNGWVEGVSIGSLYLLENQVAQLRFARGRNKNISIDNLTIVDSNKVAIDAGGVDSTADNVSIAHADIDDGECMGLDLLRSVSGVRNGKLFENSGVTYIAPGQATVTVPHGLENRPLHVLLTAYHPDARGVYVSAVDPTNFTINSYITVTDWARIAWQARTGIQLSLELLANGDVETGSGAPDNWTASGSGTSWDNTAAHSGTYSLRISGNFSAWISAPFAAVPYGRYRVALYVKGVGNAFTELLMRFYANADGTGYLGEAALPLPSTADYVGQFVRVQADVSAPAGTQSADILFRCNAGNFTDVYGDDFGFQLTSGGSNLLANASVESGGAAPDNWTLSGATWASGTARTGSRSLRLVSGGSVAQARAQWVAITGGSAYTVSAWLNGVAAGNVALVVQWFSDAGGIGNLIREDVEYFIGTYSSWTQVTAAFSAPATAQSAYVLFRMAGWSNYDLRGDAFSVKMLI